MRSEIAKMITDETPQWIKDGVSKYGEELLIRHKEVIEIAKNLPDELIIEGLMAIASREWHSLNTANTSFKAGNEKINVIEK
jgi:hypothetical protein